MVLNLMDIYKFTIPEIIFGRGCLDYAGICAKQLGASRIFVVSDNGVENAGWVNRLLKILEKENLDYVYYCDVTPNPKDYQIHNGAELYKEAKADVILALGGGSPMDAAKGIALLVSNGGNIQDYEGVNRVGNPLPPMVFIPTTMGSESDISQFVVVTDVRRQIKMTIISRTLMPNITIRDPMLLTTLSRDLIIGPLFDSLSHAVESYVSPIANSFTETQSLKGLDILVQNIRPALETLELNYLEKVATAGIYAGMAFSNASVGLGHALAHALGGMYDITHGIAHCLLLPGVMRFNLSSCEMKMAKIGKIVTDTELNTNEATALLGIEAIEKLRNDLRVPSQLREILANKKSLKKISQNAVNDTCMLTNPKKANWEDMYRIYCGAW
jgi:alcohol dehydrogenase class IV